MNTILFVMIACNSADLPADQPTPSTTIQIGANEPGKRHSFQWMDFFPKGDRIAIRTALPLPENRACPDAVIGVYDVANGRRRASVTIPLGGDTFTRAKPACAISPNGDWVAYGGGGLNFLVLSPYDPALPGADKPLSRPLFGGSFGTSVWAGKGGTLFAVPENQLEDEYSLKQWTPATGTASPTTRELVKGGGGVSTSTIVALNPSSGRFAVAVNPDFREEVEEWVIECWQVEGKPKKVTIKTGLRPIEMAISPDGKTLLAGLGDGSICWYDTTTGKLTRRSPIGKGSVSTVAFHPKGDLVACGTFDRKGKPNLYCLDVKSGEIVSKVVVNESGIWAVCFSSNGEKVATFGEAELKIWDTAALLKK